ncbi:MAG: PorV/PorQ family protein [Elusimicrobiales bacterium]|nr:PorV/PorQ family protein [Elusimicrobiales bacterium]
MRKRRNFLSFFFFLLMAACLLFPVRTYASGADVGTSTGQFLKIASGARAAAMGEAFSAAADDAFALDWNPAAATNIRYKSIALMHSMYLADTSLSYLAYAENTGDMGAWGISAKYMSYGSIEGTSEHGEITQNMSPYDLALSIAFSCYITGFNKDPEDRFIMGAAGKFISSKISNSDNTLSADIGLLSPWFLGRHLRFSFAGQNLIGSMRFDKEENDLPMIIRAGSLYKVSDFLSFTADMISYSDYDTVFAAGSELKLKLISSREMPLEAALRGGLNTRNKDEAVKGSNNFSLGAGLKFGDVYSFDYAYSPFGDLGDVHRFSLSVNFKKPVVRKKRLRGT